MSATQGLTARGRAGALWVAGRRAAVLGPWTLTTTTTGQGVGWRVEADLTEPDPHRLDSGGPFRLVLLLGPTRVLSWRGLPAAGVTWTDGAITITGEGEPEDAA